jgi:hypothetical protein
MKIDKGATVLSQPIGSKESFVGTVVDVQTNGKNIPFYIVRDCFNLRWFRDEEDLTLVLAS